MLNLFIGLASVMLANVLMGVTLAKLKKNFNKKKMLEGLVKVVSVLSGIGLMYLTSYLNPDILVANINGSRPVTRNSDTSFTFGENKGVASWNPTKVLTDNSWAVPIKIVGYKPAK